MSRGDPLPIGLAGFGADGPPVVGVLGDLDERGSGGRIGQRTSLLGERLRSEVGPDGQRIEGQPGLERKQHTELSGMHLGPARTSGRVDAFVQFDDRSPLVILGAEGQHARGDGDTGGPGQVDQPRDVALPLLGIAERMSAW